MHLICTVLLCSRLTEEAHLAQFSQHNVFSVESAASAQMYSFQTLCQQWLVHSRVEVAAQKVSCSVHLRHVQFNVKCTNMPEWTIATVAVGTSMFLRLVHTATVCIVHVPPRAILSGPFLDSSGSSNFTFNTSEHLSSRFISGFGCVFRHISISTTYPVSCSFFLEKKNYMPKIHFHFLDKSGHFSVEMPSLRSLLQTHAQFVIVIILGPVNALLSFGTAQVPIHVSHPHPNSSCSSTSWTIFIFITTLKL